MKKFIGEVLSGDGGCEQFDFTAETHGDAFEMLMDTATSSHASAPGNIGGPSETYPGDTVRVTHSVWEELCNDQVWNPETEEWEDEEEDNVL